MHGWMQATQLNPSEFQHGLFRAYFFDEHSLSGLKISNSKFIEGKIMDVFKYLDLDHRRIDQQLRSLIEHYDQWPIREVFDKSVRIFDEIRHHFERQESLLCASIRGMPDAEKLMNECLLDRKNIQAEIDSLLMSHVDDADFKDELRALLTKIDKHIQLSHETLYVKLQECLSPEALLDLEGEFEQMILA